MPGYASKFSLPLIAPGDRMRVVMLSFFAIFSKTGQIMPDFDDYLLVSEYPDQPVERMVVAFRGWPDAGSRRV